MGASQGHEALDQRVGLVRRGSRRRPRGAHRAALAGATPLLVISIVINTSTPPLPSAERCWALGVALRDALSTRRERVAILATGGLSHDPLARWVDEPFDRWFLNALEAPDVDALTKLFKVDTEVLLGRTGEIRSWITVAGACGVRAGVVDYFAARQARLGVGFSLWQPE
jgi:protocatechuate 4,5-dioxygenase beta chain